MSDRNVQAMMSQRHLKNRPHPNIAETKTLKHP
jgi:hypothetical protein